MRKRCRYFITNLGFSWTVRVILSTNVKLNFILHKKCAIIEHYVTSSVRLSKYQSELTENIKDLLIIKDIFIEQQIEDNGEGELETVNRKRIHKIIEKVSNRMTKKTAGAELVTGVLQ